MDGTEIKALRARLKLTQAQLAQLLGVHPISVSRWESNDPRHRPTAYQIGMMRSFEKAARDDEISNVLAGTLVTEGAIAAAALLLGAAFKKRPDRF